MKNAKKGIKLEKRFKPRKAYSGHIFFTSNNGFHEGKLKNYSRHGLFIKTNACLSVGDVIIIALPHLNGKKIKCKGQIIWRNQYGCGIELFRKRSIPNLRIIKWLLLYVFLNLIILFKYFQNLIFFPRLSKADSLICR